MRTGKCAIVRGSTESQEILIGWTPTPQTVPDQLFVTCIRQRIGGRQWSSYWVADDWAVDAATSHAEKVWMLTTIGFWILSSICSPLIWTSFLSPLQPNQN